MAKGSSGSAARASRRTRGQAAGLSRGQVLTAALRLLEQSPDAELTMSRVAAALAVTPMALYSHVRDRDDLFAGVAERVFWTVPQDIKPDPDYRIEVRAWLYAFRDHLSHYPQVVRRAFARSGRVAVPQMGGTAALSRILRRAGLSGCDLADAVNWLFCSVWGAVLVERQAIESYGSSEQWEAAAIAAIPVHAPADQIEILQILSLKSTQSYDGIFAFAVDRLISELSHFVASRAEPQPAVPAATVAPRKRGKAAR